MNSGTRVCSTECGKSADKQYFTLKHNTSTFRHDNNDKNFGTIYVWEIKLNLEHFSTKFQKVLNQTSLKKKNWMN